MIDVRALIKAHAESKQKLTEANVLEIRRLYAAGGITQRALARQFGIADVNPILKGKQWKHLLPKDDAPKN